MTTPVPSASATAVRTRSARRSASPIDFDSVEDGCVTVRDRDTMEQQRVPVGELRAIIEQKIAF